VRGVARQIEQVDFFVRDLQVTARQLVTLERLQDHRPIEQEQRVRAARLARQIFLAANVELLVHELERSGRLPGVERVANRERMIGVARATGEAQPREHQQDDAAKHDADESRARPAAPCR
jgi:hypothetical protein